MLSGGSGESSDVEGDAEAMSDDSSVPEPPQRETGFQVASKIDPMMKDDLAVSRI